MNKKNSITYKDAGVNISTGREAVNRIKGIVKETFNKNVLTEIGSFGGLFRFEKDRYDDPVLVSSTDGVGTKLKIAYMTGSHDTVGADLVNHCVNDILVMGAEPLFFLDYIGTSKLKPNVVEQIIKGMAEACKENDCALIGGEMAEMPGIYKDKEYDLASTIVGVVERKKIIDGSMIRAGDKVIGLMSSGLHTNGYSLVIKLLLDNGKMDLNKEVPQLGCKLKDELLKIHRSYLKPIRKIMRNFEIKGLAHITGGGILENIPRILPDQIQVIINKGSWVVPGIFKLIQEKGNIAEREMFRTFNMGVGMVLICSKNHCEEINKELNNMSFKSEIIGDVVKGEKKVSIK